jgi:chromosome partitioning protein
MKIFAVYNAKGGVAKSTTAIHMAAGFKIADKSLRVLLMDMDPQGTLKTYYKLKLDRGTTIDFIFNTALEECIYQVPINLSESDEIFHFDVIPSSAKLGDFEAKAAQIPGKEFLLKTRFDEVQIEKFYDVVILDCPPALGLATQNSLCAADHIILPAQMDAFSSAAINFLLATLEPIGKYLKLNPNLLGVLPTMFDARTIANKDVLEQLKKAFPKVYFFEPIRNNTQFKRCALNKKTVYEYESGALNGTSDYSRFCRDVILKIGGLKALKDKNARIKGASVEATI